MKLIVEAGSSKTDIAVTHAGEVLLRRSMPGMNPVTDPEYARKMVNLVGALPHRAKLSSVFYYGAGCVSPSVNRRVADLFKPHLSTTATIEISDDLSGACTSVSAGVPSLVCILGTGSNACFFDGREIVLKIRSCGYLLGDEGSGYRLGQEIYLRMSRNQLPATVEEAIRSQYALAGVDLVSHLYEVSDPRYFLASFAVATALLDQATRKEVTEETFDCFINRMVLPLHAKHPVPVAFVGSVAFHFQEDLKQMLEKYNIIARSFDKTPMDGLIKYHHEHE